MVDFIIKSMFKQRHFEFIFKKKWKFNYFWKVNEIRAYKSINWL